MRTKSPGSAGMVGLDARGVALFAVALFTVVFLPVALFAVVFFAGTVYLPL